jgi:hypothetical protein
VLTAFLDLEDKFVACYHAGLGKPVRITGRSACSRLRGQQDKVPRRQWNMAVRWVDLLTRQRPRAWCLGQLLSHRGQFGYTAVARCRAIARTVASTHLGDILRGSTHLVGRGGPPLLHATMLGANPSIDKPIRRRCSSQGEPPAADREQIPRGAILERELRIWGLAAVFGNRLPLVENGPLAWTL